MVSESATVSDEEDGGGDTLLSKTGIPSVTSATASGEETGVEDSTLEVDAVLSVGFETEAVSSDTGAEAPSVMRTP